MMPAGMASPTDSVTAPIARQHVGVVTTLSALVVVAFLAVMAWLQYGGSRVETVEDPERALALIVGRTMDLDDAIARAPAWERLFYRIMSTEPAEDLAEALRWYEELAATSFDPTVDLHLAVLEGEARRLESVRRRVAEWSGRPDPLPDLAHLVAAAYLGGELDPDVMAFVQSLGEGLEPGWFRDRIVERVAARVGDRETLAAVTEAQAARSSALLARMRVMVAVELVWLGVALAALLQLISRRGALARVGSAFLPPRWPGREGLAVLVRGGALGVLVLGALYVYSALSPELPATRLMLGTATNLSFVPVLILAQRRLLRPSGLGFGEGFGLIPAAGGGRGLAFAFLTLFALGQLGEGAMDIAGRWLGMSAHWTEWFDADLVWGTPAAVGLTILDTVVLTPVFEEIVFRGLLFATLRRRFGAGTAAVLSAAIFAVAHGYGVLGFAAVFWSGLLWAWAYERTGSLLPSIASHATDNLIAGLSVILVLRG
jgi:membrane protease YdiL (CAAX protease family)